jgi:hypothetical protein
MRPYWRDVRRMIFRRTTNPDSEAKRCADECAAFLNGRALEIYEANGLQQSKREATATRKAATGIAPSPT